MGSFIDLVKGLPYPGTPAPGRLSGFVALVRANLVKERVHHWKHGWIWIGPGMDPRMHEHLGAYHESMSRGRFAEAAHHLGRASMIPRDPKVASHLAEQASRIAHGAPGPEGRVTAAERATHGHMAEAHRAAAAGDHQGARQSLEFAAANGPNEHSRATIRGYSREAAVAHLPQPAPVPAGKPGRTAAKPRAAAGVPAVTHVRSIIDSPTHDEAVGHAAKLKGKDLTEAMRLAGVQAMPKDTADQKRGRLVHGLHGSVRTTNAIDSGVAGTWDTSGNADARAAERGAQRIAEFRAARHAEVNQRLPAESLGVVEPMSAADHLDHAEAAIRAGDHAAAVNHLTSAAGKTSDRKLRAEIEGSRNRLAGAIMHGGPATDDGLGGRSTAELRAIAAAEGLALPPRGKKAELVQAIRDQRHNRDRGGARVFATEGGQFGAPAKAEPAPTVSSRSAGKRPPWVTHTNGNPRDLTGAARGHTSRRDAYRQVAADAASGHSHTHVLHDDKTERFGGARGPQLYETVHHNETPHVAGAPAAADVRGVLRGHRSAAEARDYLDGLGLDQAGYRKLAEDLDVPFQSRDTKAKIRDNIVAVHVRGRAITEAVRDPRIPAAGLPGLRGAPSFPEMRTQHGSSAVSRARAMHRRGESPQTIAEMLHGQADQLRSEPVRDSRDMARNTLDYSPQEMRGASSADVKELRALARDFASRPEPAGDRATPEQHMDAAMTALRSGDSATAARHLEARGAQLSAAANAARQRDVIEELAAAHQLPTVPDVPAAAPAKVIGAASPERQAAARTAVTRYVAGGTVASVAQEMGISPSKVRSMLAESGIQMRQPGGRRGPRAPRLGAPVPADAVDRMRNATSREEALALAEPLRGPALDEALRHAGSTVNLRTRKDKITHLVEMTAGRRLDFDAIGRVVRGEPAPGFAQQRDRRLPKGAGFVDMVRAVVRAR